MGRRIAGAILGLGLFLPACAQIGQILNAPERPPQPLVEAGISSDARIDSTGAIAGSFVGEGTSRRVHLLSSDPEFIAQLVRRWRPERERRIDPIDWLNRKGTWAVNLDRAADSSLLSQVILVGSPDGHTRVRLSSVLLYGAACRDGGPRAELVVEPARGAPVSLRGPVIGAVRGPDVWWPVQDTYRRDPPADPAPDLVDTLIERTGLVMDSMLAARLPARELPLSGGYHRLAVNSLANEDAADVVAIRFDDGRIRYAVSLRDTRYTARGTEGLASIVMIWDATLSWQQVVFLPTFLEYGRRGPMRALGGRTAPLYWRRLQPVSGFAFERDYLWMEQVDVTTGLVRWVILEPKGNILVAAADVEDGC
ncbi:MAG TPA: hypothetical protein VG692_08860 [Gemmatimonadales bacterium]|nr:hypothetical protein [Gemmatimonadales bacterium]